MHKPPNEVPQLPSTPAGSSPVTVPTNTVTNPTDTPQPAASVGSTTPTDPVQITQTDQAASEPSDEAVLTFIQPHLAVGTTMANLRQKLGHERGKEWTARLNRIANLIIKLRNRRTKSTIRQPWRSDMEPTL